ncbi:MAG: inositol monophosphatase [Chloroflexi bacterium]|nr:MAG: inositol monophosphatase [Phototrophicales bacterium]RMF81476.1 MAG: inositol monophosphatase [Chloroflexota bacterium]
MSELDLHETHAHLHEIARQAGVVVMDYFNQPHEETTKANIFDIATAGDKASEKIIVEALQNMYPDHHIVGEEGGGYDALADEAEYFWYIDPIDGTSNYANGIPHFAISIAVTNRDNMPLVGIVFNPARDELYAAIRGHGATLNDAPIHVSSKESLSQSIIATGFPHSHSEKLTENMNEWDTFLTYGVRGMRRFGSAALELCWVANGRLEAYWERYLNPWDCLAGILCVEEAGGHVSDFSGTTTHAYTGEQVLASNNHVHEEMRRLLNGA